MKVAARDVARFCGDPPGHLAAMLLYGTNEGLVRDLARAACESVAGDANDPFLVAELVGTALKERPDLLFDEVNALALTGGRRVVRVAAAGDSISGLCAEVLETTSEGALVILEAGALAPRSSLRRLFEAADNCAAIPCYDDDTGNLQELIENSMQAHNVSVDRDAVAWLNDRLGSDRRQITAELDKLSVYAGVGGSIGLAEAQLLVGDAAALSVDDLCLAVASGDIRGVDRTLRRVFEDGVTAVQAIRSISRYLMRLQLAATKVEAGASAEQAMTALRPPVFFKQKEKFRYQLGVWSVTRLSDALVILVDAEKACKGGGGPDRAVCGRALFSVTSAARRRS